MTAPEILRAVDNIRRLTPALLADAADVCMPDAAFSPGARLLKMLRDQFLGHVQWIDEHEDLVEWVDTSYPEDFIASTPAQHLALLDKHVAWGMFLDLAAYDENVDEDLLSLGLDAVRDRALEAIGIRLLTTLLGDLQRAVSATRDDESTDGTKAAVGDGD